MQIESEACFEVKTFNVIVVIIIIISVPFPSHSSLNERTSKNVIKFKLRFLRLISWKFNDLKSKRWLWSQPGFKVKPSRTSHVTSKAASYTSVEQKIKTYFHNLFSLPDAYEAEQLLKEVDIHSVTGNLKSYLRELPEALFTDYHYQKVSETFETGARIAFNQNSFQFFDTFNQFTNTNESARIDSLQVVFNDLPQPNKATISLILDHLIR